MILTHKACGYPSKVDRPIDKGLSITCANCKDRFPYFEFDEHPEIQTHHYAHTSCGFIVAYEHSDDDVPTMLACADCDGVFAINHFFEVPTSAVEKAYVDTDTLEDCFPILEYFKCGHLPQNLQDVSMPFGVLAFDIARRWHDKHEDAKTFEQTEMALEHLLIAKDAAVRASL